MLIRNSKGLTLFETMLIAVLLGLLIGGSTMFDYSKILSGILG